MGIQERLLGELCEHCGTKRTSWHQQSPQSNHAYKVTCSGCDKFIKWGTKDEYERLTKRKLTEFVAYSPEPPFATLDKFFE